jgi:methionyl-tRNA formyltransferase
LVPQFNCGLKSARVLAARGLNSKKVLDLLDEVRPEAVMVYGTGLLKETLKRCPYYTINFHGGLSP